MFSALRRLILKVLGVSETPALQELPDGTLFRPWPAQAGPEWGWIMRGCSDLSGMKWAKYNGGKPCWNECELNGPWFATGPNDPELDRIRQYGGAPPNNPTNWPELYSRPYFETHKY